MVSVFKKLKKVKLLKLGLCGLIFICVFAIVMFSNGNTYDAYAWTNPGGYSYDYTAANDYTGTLFNLSSPTAQTKDSFSAAAAWSAYETGKGSLNSSRNYTNQGDTGTNYVMIWVDLQLSAEMKTAITNNRITSISIGLKSKTGSEYFLKGSKSYISHYIASGTTGGTSADSFTTAYSSSSNFSHNAYDSYDTDSSTLSLTNAQLRNCSYIRFGVHVKFTKDFGTTHKIIFDRPSVTSYSVSYSGVTGTFAAGTGGTVSSTSSTLSFGSANYAVATANAGYYFTGWSNGYAHRTINLAGYNYSANTTFTASFAQITYTGGIGFTFTGNGQGPSAVTATNFSMANTYTGTTNGGSSYNSTSKPSQAGSYSLKITVVRSSTSETVGTRDGISFTIGKANVSLSSVSATSITYGQTLANSTVTGTATNTSNSSVTASGSFLFASSGTKPSVTDSNSTSYAVTFTPDTASSYNYNSGNGNCMLTVNKCTPTISGLLATDITYGQTLTNSAVSGTSKNGYDNSTVEGTFVFTSSSTKPNVANSSTTAYSVSFTPTSGINYNTVTSLTCTLIVKKCTPTLSSLSSTGIIYGQTLASSTVSGTSKNGYDNATVGGIWRYTSQTTAPTYANNGTAYGVTFTPTDTANYNAATSTCAVSVSQRIVSITWSNTVLIYNKTLQKPTCTAGNLVFSDSCTVTVSGEKTDVGNNYTASASALSNSNYALPAANTSTFAITPATVSLDWSNTEPTYNGSNQIPVAMATNLFGGDSCTITVGGEKSQAGTGYTATATAVSNPNYKLPTGVTSLWSILPKSLPVSFWQNSVEASYLFTGGRIYPSPVVTDNPLGLLTKDTDYTVSYEQNYSVLTGGTVFVEGIGNYQSATQKTFTIAKAAHNVFFTSLRYQNGGVGIEPIAPLSSEFEIPFIPNLGYDGNYITVYAFTDAVYSEEFSASANPDLSTMSAKQLLFEADSNVIIEYISNEIVEISGKYYSKTTAKVYLSDQSNIVQYGVTRLTLGAEDNVNYTPLTLNEMPSRLIEDGYLQDLGADDATYLSHRIFIKKNHTAGGSFLDDIIKIYGDEVFDLTAGLNSGLTDFTLTSSNTDVLTVSGEGAARAAAIKNAGTTTISLFHPGVSDLIYPTNSYISVSKQITVTVNRAVLTVTPADKTTVYGTAPSYANIQASFVFGGFRYTDDYQIIASLSSGYNPSVMHDAGIYYLTASDATLNTVYQNYNFEYPDGGGMLTITRKTVYAFIEDSSRVYGENNPVFDLSYTGFVYPENQATAAEFAMPSVEYNGTDRLSAVGQYTITLSGGSARNYNINIADVARLTITPAFASIGLETKTADYSAKSVFANIPVISGVAGGTTPLGSAAVLYLYDDGYSQAAPVEAGSYGVRIIYTAGENDNYKNTSADVDIAITILPIDPSFILEAVTLDYNAEQYGGVPSAALVEAGVEGGSLPIGSLSFLYCREGGEFTAELPINSGLYTVRATYNLLEGVKDNYKDGAYYDFVHIISIEKIDVTMDLEKAISTYSSSDGTAPDTLSANQAVAHGVFTEYTLDAGIYPHNLTYRYLIGGLWETEPPFDAGSYDVEVTFSALSDLNYRDTLAVFSNAVEILRALPTLSLESKTISYTGKRAAQNTATVSGIIGGSVPQGNFEYLFAPSGSLYALFSKDYPVVNVNLVNGVNEGYDIIVRYVAYEGGNYANYEQRFDRALTVLPVTPKLMLMPSSANFTGAAFDSSVITASVIGLAGGSMPVGSLSYQFMSDGLWTSTLPIDSGTYSVKATFTPATSGNSTYANYMEASGVFADSIVINKVSPSLTMVPLKSDYTGGEVVMAEGNITIVGVSPAYLPAGTLKIQYGLSPDEWSDYGPTESGIYKIRLIYTAAADENYTDVTKIFNNAVTIYNIAPVFQPLASETHIFSGERAAVTFQPQIEGNPGKGSLTLNYKVGSGWTSRVPSDAGIYDVRINYTATTKDNYKSYMQSFASALIILPREITITPLPNQTKVFDNMPSEYLGYTVSGLMAGDSLTGALTTSLCSDAGNYEILIGDVRIDTSSKPENYAANYSVNFTEGVIYQILPAEVELSFQDIDEGMLVYRPSDNKSKYVYVTANRGSEFIRISVSIVGDDLNVGSFKVVVSLDNSNYRLPENFEKTYYITEADMEESDNIFVDKTYSYSGDKYAFAADRIFDGASITYYYGGDMSETPFKFDKVGEYTVEATISKDNYHPLTVEAKITIVKARPEVNVIPYTGKLVYGDALPQISCKAEGTIGLDENQALIPGAYEYNWTFIPDEEANYLSVTGKIRLTVEKAATSVVVDGNTEQDVTSPTRFSATITTESGVLQGNINIQYFDKDGHTFTQLPSKAGKYTLVVTFSGDEFYAASSYSTEITVSEQTSYNWLYILIGVIVVIGIIAGIASASRRKA